MTNYNEDDYLSMYDYDEVNMRCYLLVRLEVCY